MTLRICSLCNGSNYPPLSCCLVLLVYLPAWHLVEFVPTIPISVHYFQFSKDVWVLPLCKHTGCCPRLAFLSSWTILAENIAQHRVLYEAVTSSNMLRDGFLLRSWLNDRALAWHALDWIHSKDKRARVYCHLHFIRNRSSEGLV